MAAPTETYIDPADGAAAGNDHGGNAFIDGVFNSGAPNQLTKIGAFTAATCQAGDKIYLDDNGSGEVTAGLYTISTRDSDDAVTLTADIRSGGPEPTDVRCDNHTGAVGLPWATVQHALDFTTRDAADGDRFNVKAGTDDVLAAALDFTTYGVPTQAAPWICHGYTAAVGDGGIGGINGGGANISIVGGDILDYLAFFYMHLHNTGTEDVLSLDNNIAVVACEIDNTTGFGLDLDNNPYVCNCYVHNCGNEGIHVGGSGLVLDCTLANGANKFTTAIYLSGTLSKALGNVIAIDAGSVGIRASNDTEIVIGNSIYSAAGIGTGILVDAAAQLVALFNNIVEGFSGVGGEGITTTAGSTLAPYGFNAFYNNTTQLTQGGVALIDFTANDINPLASSAFIDAANGDFRVKPSVQALGYPTANYPGLAVRSYLDMGALQRMSQMFTHPGMAGGSRG